MDVGRRGCLVLSSLSYSFKYVKKRQDAKHNGVP